MKKKIVVSAINLYTGGTLSVLKDVLGYLSLNVSDEYEVIALVHKKELFYSLKGIQLIEFPKSRESWFKRLYYEFVYFKKLSQELKPHLWLSLHDISPNVTATVKAVYCHNASAFYNLGLNEVKVEPGFALQKFYYEYLYRLNINNNDFVIVQQNWLREKFKPWVKKGKIVVSYPISSNIPSFRSRFTRNETFVFFYPSLPRAFKNFETLCKAAVLLQEKGIKGYKVKITVGGDENWYAKALYEEYKVYSCIEFLGFLSREEVFEEYGKADCLVFPSKLESWGMPISEFMTFQKPILIADLLYAYETIGAYPSAAFFNPNDPFELAKSMEAFIKGTICFDKPVHVPVEAPFASNWEELFGILLAEKQSAPRRELMHR